MPESKSKGQSVKEKTVSKTVSTVAKKSVMPKTAEVKQGGLSVRVLGLDGKSAGTLTLPKEVFGAEVNAKLLAQAVKVYSTNAQSHHGHTKTRGEVNLTTAKWFRQKGTGRARHGAKSAPIFVGGGVAMGPRSRKVTLDLPEKMKKAALISALSQRVKEGEVAAVSGLDKATGKTKEMTALLGKRSSKAEEQKVSSVLIVADKAEMAARAVRNLPKVSFMTPDHVNVFEIIKHKSLLLTKEAVEKLEQRLVKSASVKTSADKEGATK